MDEATRALERRARDDPAAETALLAQRMRSGALAQERVELAAYCGHAPALDVLGRDRVWWPTRALPSRPLTLGGQSSMEAWVTGLLVFEDIAGHSKVLMIAGVAAARSVLDNWQAMACCDPADVTSCSHGRERVVRAIGSAETWIACPCSRHERDLSISCNMIGPRMRFVSSLMHVVYSIGRDVYFPDAVLDAVERVGEETVRKAVSSALIALALA